MKIKVFAEKECMILLFQRRYKPLRKMIYGYYKSVLVLFSLRYDVMSKKHNVVLC